MRDRTLRSYALPLLVATGLLLAGCGEEGSSGAAPTTPSPAGTGAAAPQRCDPVADQKLVVLADDKRLQTADNIIPAVNAKVATQPLLDALNKVSEALTQDELIQLNRSTDLDRTPPATVAKDWVQAKGLGTGLGGGSGKIVVGAANFSENQTLANVYVEVLRAAGFDASVKTVGNRELYEPALEKGEIHVMPEYVGTLTEFLNKKQNGPGAAPKATGDAAASASELAALGEKVGLKFGKPAAAADQNAFATTKAFADKYGVTTLSDLANKCTGLKLGGPPECPQRPFCQPGLQQTYGLKFAGFTALDAGGPLVKTALKQGRISLGLVFSSDAALVG